VGANVDTQSDTKAFDIYTLRENVIKIVRGKLELHAGEVQTLYNGWTMDLVKFRENFDGRQTPAEAGDGRRKPWSMPRGRRQERSVAGWSAGAPVKAGLDGQGPAKAGRQKPRRN